MEKLDKDLETPFVGIYEGLSEHSHPNAHGMALTYVQTHRACVTTYTDQKPVRVDASMSLAISALTSALQIADMANRHWDEERNAFILLAEKQVHEAGTWPADIRSDSSTKRRVVSNNDSKCFVGHSLSRRHRPGASIGCLAALAVLASSRVT